MKRFAVVVAAALLAAALPACSADNLSFKTDTRVEIVSPVENERVRLPAHIRWTVADFDGRFGVFIDRAPMRPGRTVRSLVPEKDPCRQLPRCPDERWLADRGIYVTDATELVLERLPNDDDERRTDAHDVTIVLLDAEGRRVGEAAFITGFRVDEDRR